jgi:hypothetical protein
MAAASRTRKATAAGATRIKRLKDMLGNQLLSALLVKSISRLS